MNIHEISHDVCRALKKWTGAKVRRIKTLPSGQEVESRELSGPGQEDLHVGVTGGDQDIWKHTWPAVTLYRLENVFCTGDQGQLFFDDRHLFDVCPSLKRLPDCKVRRPVISKAVWIEEPVFHLSGFSPENHGHYFFHHLPRFLAARRIIEENPRMKILCAHKHSRWQGRYLSRFGISPDRLIETSTRTLGFRELYYVPVAPGTFKLGVPAHYRTMQKAFAGEEPVAKKGYPIWISRLDAPDKALANEKELIACVADIFGGVNVVELSKWNMDQQVKLFGEARFIFGALGQGLANILYTRESVLVILAARVSEKPVGASLMTGAAGAMVGNRALCLNSGTDYQGPKREWIFPEARFRAQVLEMLEGMKKAGLPV